MKSPTANSLTVPNQQQPPQSRPLLAHRYSPMTVNQPICHSANPRLIQSPSPKSQPPQHLRLLKPPTPKHIRQLPSSPQPQITHRNPQQHDNQHKTIDINLNINVNTGTEEELTVNMNQQARPVSNAQNFVKKVRQLPQQQISYRQGVQLMRSLSPVRGIHGLGQQMQVKAVPPVTQQHNIQLLPQPKPPTPKSLHPPAQSKPTILATNITTHSRLSDNNSFIGFIPLNPSQQIDVQTDPCEEFQVKSEKWKLSAIRQPQVITCVLCKETYNVADTMEHVRRHRKQDKDLVGVDRASVVTSVVLREPQIRPIVEPKEFVVKPTENYYVLEKIGKGGRSSFSSKPQSLVVIQTPTPASPPTEPIQPPATLTNTSGILIGGTQPRRLLDPPLDTLSQMPSSLQQTQHNRSSRMNPHTVVIQAPPHPVAILEQQQRSIQAQPITSLVVNERSNQINVSQSSSKSSEMGVHTAYIREPRVVESITTEDVIVPTIPVVPSVPVMPAGQSTRIVIQDDPAGNVSKIIITQDVYPVSPSQYTANGRVIQPLLPEPLPAPSSNQSSQKLQNPQIGQSLGIRSVYNPPPPSISQSSIHTVNSSLVRFPTQNMPMTIFNGQIGQGSKVLRQGSKVIQTQITEKVPVVTTIVKETKMSDGSVKREVAEMVEEKRVSRVVQHEEGFNTGGRIHQIEVLDKYRHTNVPPPPSTLVSPGLSLGITQGELFPAIPQEHLEFSGMNGINGGGFQMQQKPTSNSQLEYNFVRTSQQHQKSQEQLHQKAAHQSHRVRVPKNILAEWGS